MLFLIGSQGKDMYYNEHPYLSSVKKPVDPTGDLANSKIYSFMMQKFFFRIYNYQEMTYTIDELEKYISIKLNLLSNQETATGLYQGKTYQTDVHDC